MYLVHEKTGGKKFTCDEEKARRYLEAQKTAKAEGDKSVTLQVYEFHENTKGDLTLKKVTEIDEA